MMKTIVIVNITLLGLVYCGEDEKPIKKCHAFSGEDANYNLENAVQVYKNCFNASLVNFVHLVATNTCTNTLPIRECNHNIIKKIEDCNSADESYFPKRIFTIVSDYAFHICSRAPSYKFPILLEHKICYPSLSSGIDCFRKFRFFNVSTNLTREEMCTDEKEVSNCLLNYINGTCPKDLLFENIVTRVFNFDQPPCKATSQIIVYSTILIFSAMLTTMFTTQ